MSENKDLPKTVDQIPIDSLVDVQISGAYYARLHQLLMWIAQQKPAEEFAREVQKMKEDKIDTPYGYHLETILVLVYEVEGKFKSQGKMKTIETEKIIKKEV